MRFGRFGPLQGTPNTEPHHIIGRFVSRYDDLGNCCVSVAKISYLNQSRLAGHKDHTIQAPDHFPRTSISLPRSHISKMAEVTLANSLREKMLRDEVAYTLSVKLVRSVELPMMAKTAGFDGILIDMEHSSFDLDTTSQICIAALYAGIAPIVRVPSKDPCFVSRVLDGGALGVIVPHIRSVQDAKDVVTAAKFQPQGYRSSTNNLPHFQYRALAAKKSNPVVNANTLVIPMVETLEAVECVEELAALDGVDSLLIGTNDMTAEMGIPGDYDNPRLTEVYEKTIAACKKHGKWVGIGGLHSRLDLVEKFCTMGARWVMAATDGPLLLGGATKRAGEMAQLNTRVQAATVSKFDVKKNVNGVSNGVKTGVVDVRVDEVAIDVR